MSKLVHLGTKVIVSWGSLNEHGDVSPHQESEFHLVSLKDDMFDHLRNAVQTRRVELEAGLALAEMVTAAMPVIEGKEDLAPEGM